MGVVTCGCGIGDGRVRLNVGLCTSFRWLRLPSLFHWLITGPPLTLVLCVGGPVVYNTLAASGVPCIVGRGLGLRRRVLGDREAMRYLSGGWTSGSGQSQLEHKHIKTDVR